MFVVFEKFVPCQQHIVLVANYLADVLLSAFGAFFRVFCHHHDAILFSSFLVKSHRRTLLSNGRTCQLVGVVCSYVQWEQSRLQCQYLELCRCEQKLIQNIMYDNGTARASNIAYTHKSLADTTVFDNSMSIIYCCCHNLEF